MSYITREIQEKLISLLKDDRAQGVILAGPVGCGKSTLIKKILADLVTEREHFYFSGDDAHFRTEILGNTRYLLDFVLARTTRPPLIFIDEVHKSPGSFEALKLAFDEGKIPFVVSGSNPNYLATTARNLLQRRAHFLALEPFSVLEILHNLGHANLKTTSNFLTSLLIERPNLTEISTPSFGPLKEIEPVLKRYLTIGGTPLGYFANSDMSALSEVQMVIERGISDLGVDTGPTDDMIRIYLANTHSREFSYQSIFQKTGLRSRYHVNKTIDALIGAGYLVQKKPVFPNENHRSYLTIYSYTDPGFVSYLSGKMIDADELGFRVEGHIHARLAALMQRIPLKSQIGYYKPFSLDVNEKVKFIPGEIDFIINLGSHWLPIEVKSGLDVSQDGLRHIEKFMAHYKVPYGIVLYGGMPRINKEKRILFYPWWGL